MLWEGISCGTTKCKYIEQRGVLDGNGVLRVLAAIILCVFGACIMFSVSLHRSVLVGLSSDSLTTCDLSPVNFRTSLERSQRELVGGNCQC